VVWRFKGHTNPLLANIVRIVISMKMIGNRTGHRLHLRVVADQPIQFDRDDVRALAASTTEYLGELLGNMQQTMTAPPSS